MKQKLFILYILVFLNNSWGQKEDLEACGCSLVFKEMISKLESNYLVYEQQKQSGQLNSYIKLKEKYASIVDLTPTEECTLVLHNFLSYYNDGHLFVFDRPKYSREQKDSLKEEIKSSALPKPFLENKIQIHNLLPFNMVSDRIIGTYTDGTSKLAVIREKGVYKAYIVSSANYPEKVGELKAEFWWDGRKYKGTYYSYNFEPRYIWGYLFKEDTLFNLSGGIVWGKTTSDTYQQEVDNIDQKYPKFPVIRKLDDKNVLFSIPTFAIDGESFTTIVKDNWDVLSSTENLIIDIRGNTGGNALYLAFLELYATEPTLEGGKPGKVLASEDTKLYFEQMASYNETLYQDVAVHISNNMGKIINGPAYPNRPLEAYPSNIKNVAILMDGAVGSAAEMFVLHSKQVSSKVTTFGSATFGMIDYTSVNAIPLKTSKNQNIYFGYPTSSLGNVDFEKYPNGYNKSGILPDISIPKDTSDKIHYILKHYNQ